MTQTELTSSTIASLEAKFAKDLSRAGTGNEESIKDGAGLQRSKSQSKSFTVKQRHRYSTMSQLFGNGDNESEEQMFSADEGALDTDHEDFEDASESLIGTARFLQGHGVSGSVDLSAAHVLIRGADDMESVSSPFLAAKFPKQGARDGQSSPLRASFDRDATISQLLASPPIDNSLKSVTLEIGVQTESSDDLVRDSIYNLGARDSMATFGGGSTSRALECSRGGKVASTKNTSRSLSSSVGARRTHHAHQDSVTSPTGSDEFSRNRCSLNSVRTEETTSTSEQLTPACSPRRSLPTNSLHLDNHPINQTEPIPSSTSHKPTEPQSPPGQPRQVNPVPSSSSGFPPQRPSSPPPKELVEKAQIPRTIQLTVPTAPSIRRSSYSSMPPPSTKPRAGKASPATYASKKKASTLSRANKQFNAADNSADSSEVSQFGMALMAPVVHSSNEHIRRKMQLGNLAATGGSTEQLSHRSRRQSFNSDRTDHTSDPGDDHIPRSAAGLSAPTTTDPNAIHAITQTMIGEFLFKYTSKTLTRGFSEKRHRRFFWVHPYTKTLYWSTSDPGAHGANQSTAKSVLIESVRTINDTNVAPSGLASHSLVIQTPNREMKITAPSKERHELWFSAINYLLTRPDPSANTSPVMTQQNISPNPSTRGPAQSTFSSRNTMLSRFRTHDPSVFSTPPAVHQAIYDMSSSKSLNDSPAIASTESSERLTPKASKGPSGLPVPMKRGAATSRGSAKQLNDSPRFLQSSPADPIVFENSFSQSAFGLQQDPDRRSVSFNGVHRGDGEMADDTDVSMSYDSRCDDTFDDGFEGVENVRACCDGKHDVGSLSRRLDHSSSHDHGHVPHNRPASRGASAKQRETDRTSYVSNRALRPLDSPSLRASNLEALRSRYGGASSPGPQAQAQAQAQQTPPHLRRVQGRGSVASRAGGLPSSLQSSPAGTVSSRFHRESKFFQDLKAFNPASVEQLQTPPPRSSSRFPNQQSHHLASSVRSTRQGSVGSDLG
ncbi:hypothetical protein PTTG_10335 [Puccinia triticina 1-1 BBBD Race 1]|uniref:PH domain-containing protein n=2 Tax=Puccinia triticina TaxID=208348 RepID=A0A180GNP1_PUCT1|nr:hypothetical protein PTTG_10335 [Puccinia triticina 1-1 BBBD Race 1]